MSKLAVQTQKLWRSSLIMVFPVYYFDKNFVNSSSGNKIYFKEKETRAKRTKLLIVTETIALFEVEGVGYLWGSCHRIYIISLNNNW